MDREMAKQQYLIDRKRAHEVRTGVKKKTQRKWKKKMAKSPFHIDLVAESERIDEENRVRLREQQRRQRQNERMREKVKNEIILKALSEASDLEALRQEKRAIQLEEKRLKALLDLEKAGQHRKADLLAAQRAERHRKSAKSEYYRQQYRLAHQQREAQKTEILMEKHALTPPRSSVEF